MGIKNLYEIECGLSKYYGYAHLISGIRPLNRLYIRNRMPQDLKDAELIITSADFLLPFKKIITLPYESTVDIDITDLLVNNELLININEIKDYTVSIELTKGETLCSFSQKITVLPYYHYCGIDFNPELYSCFVNPMCEGVAKILKTAGDINKSFKHTSLGYADNDKESIKLLAALIYRAVQQKNITSETSDIKTPSEVIPVAQILSSKKATQAEVAALFMSCAEAIGLNAIAATDGKDMLCGVWLYDNCFLETSFDDITEVKKRSDEIINDIAVFDVKGMFTAAGMSFSSAQKSALNLFIRDCTVIDIKRCRIANYKPLPVRISSGNVFDIAPVSDSLQEIAGNKKINIRPIKTKMQPTKESMWERKLLDLTLKNSLLNFIPRKNMLQIMSVSANETAQAIIDNGEYSLLEMPSEFLPLIDKAQSFNTSDVVSRLSQLITLEQKNGRLRTFCDGKNLNAYTQAMYRKEKTLAEETGTSALYAACGFLKWNFPDEKNTFKYAPLILLPLTLVKKAAGKGYTVKLREEELQFNTTLTEFLKQQFGIELRGISNINAGEIESIFAAVKKQILSFKGWEVTGDIYIASLSFAGWLMWNDIRSNMETFRKNKIISSLIQSKTEPSLLNNAKTSPSQEIYLPVTADSSQTEAVKLSDKNASFILHGPPGTGKSQTITNIIANALAKNKKVLFVAEKQAALSVVKKRLDSIGIGDFCLELHSDKTVKTEVVKKLYDTSRLTPSENAKYQQNYKNLKELDLAVSSPFSSLHKKRRLGISVYEGIIKLKEYQNAPDIINIDSLFYEKLTEEKLKLYQNLLAELVSVSADLKGIYRSPFENSAIVEYDRTIVPKIITTVKILREEARHLKTYTEMCFEILCSRLRIVTKKKLIQLKELCEMLTKSDNPYKKLFENVKGTDAVNTLNNFVSVYKDFEASEDTFNKIFKSKVELPVSAEALKEELEIFPIDFSKSKPLRIFIKRINKAARQKIRIENLKDSMLAVIDYYQKKELTADAGEKLARLFSGSKVNYNQVADFILQLEKLYGAVSKIFMRYDRNSFNLTLENLFTKYPSGIFRGFLYAYDSFERGRVEFFNLLKIEKDYDEIGEDYAEFISLKAASVRDNIDMLDGWCRFNMLVKRFKEEGLKFALAPIYDGKITANEISSCFYKKVYENFVAREISEDETLAKFSSAITEEKIENFKLLSEEFEKITCAEIREKLISRLPDLNTEGSLSVELMQLQRAVKSNMRGITVRSIISSMKNLFPVLSPCLLMSPAAVAKYLPAEEQFDIAVFDEASQVPTAEAVGAIARSKCTVIVGDPKQLPPTSFFVSDYVDEDNLQLEDLESILEDCLALGLPERYLKWHYRSKHESLIAFSNALYYGNRLCTFPSTDALISKVQLKFVENGVYDRGSSKTNQAEADCVVAEVVKRLKSGKSLQSIGIVTFSGAQQTLIENKISDALIKNRLENAAYDREEPLFIKNLENVQGDERDVILFSVCYGPDRYGKLSYNFGPLNQSNGWRRLNVAASRAREEMVVFSSMTSAMIDLSKNNAKGVAGIKAFLEFAQSGKTMLAVKSAFVGDITRGIGKYISDDLTEAGYECRSGVGVSDFKIDVAVLDPKTKRFMLGIICDSRPPLQNDIKGETVLQIKTLKRLGWNVLRIWSINYLNNPKREIKKIKQYIDKIKGISNEKSENKYAKPYKEAQLKQLTTLSSYITDENNADEIKQRLSAIIKAEQPISKDVLIKKLLNSYGIIRTGSRINAQIEEILQKIDCKTEEHNNMVFYGEADNACSSYRTEENINIKRSAKDISPCEYISAAKSILTDKISLYIPDLIKEIADIFKLGRTANPETENAIKYALYKGSEKGHLTISLNDMVTL